MDIKIRLEDRLYDQYLTKHGSPKHYRMMKQAIEAFSQVTDGDRVLILHGDERRAIEAIFETTLDTPEKLLRLIKNMNTVKIEGVEVNFDEAELTRLATQASFHGRTTEQFIKEMVIEIKDRMLERA